MEDLHQDVPFLITHFAEHFLQLRKVTSEMMGVMLGHMELLQEEVDRLASGAHHPEYADHQ